MMLKLLILYIIQRVYSASICSRDLLIQNLREDFKRHKVLRCALYIFILEIKKLLQVNRHSMSGTLNVHLRCILVN